MLYTSNKHKTLQEIIFDKFDNLVFDEFIVLSGYLGPKPIEELLSLDINTKIIYGLASTGVELVLHNKLLSYLGHSVDIYVPNLPSHAKIYLWRNEGNTQYILNGSANFSTTGLNSPLREVLNEVNKTSFSEFDNYVETIFQSSVTYDTYSWGKKAKKTVGRGAIFETGSLFAEKSKINWGHGSAHTNARDAYIPLTKDDVLSYPDLFPEKAPLKGLGYADNEPIEIIWDDGETMEGLLEGTTFENKGSLHEKRYPNKISSFKNKKILGDYLRKRLGVPQGSYVTKQVFKNYGRDSISISRISEGVYSFDFSSPNT